MKEPAPASTPLWRQYTRIKQEHPDKLVFYRMGDFYELFGEDAKEASRLLGITLTSRAHGHQMERVPLAGVPHHAADKYLARLLALGRKVVICEQTEDPKQAKGLVKRAVVEILTPGTPTLETMGEARPLVAVVTRPTRWGAARLDFATGRFEVAEGEAELIRAWVEVSKPAECLVSEASEEYPALADVMITPLPDSDFRLAEARQALLEQFQTQTLAGFGVGDLDLAVGAAGAMVLYLRQTKKTSLDHLTHIRRAELRSRMFLDADTVAHLELAEARDARHPETSLLAQVDRTVTAMGRRLLVRTLTCPYAELSEILPRLGATAHFVRERATAASLRTRLARLPDFEKLAGRIGYGRAHPREVLALGLGLAQIPELALELRSTGLDYLRQLAENLPDLQAAASEIQATLTDLPPQTTTAGGLIRAGVSSELEDLRRSIADSKRYLAHLQVEERERTGIPSLKVGYNKVFGYYLEVTHAHTAAVPAHYVRRQTLVNAERYITDELKLHEDRVLGAEARIFELEEQIFLRLRDSLRRYTRELQATGEILAATDLAAAWAELAVERRYVQPELVEDGRLEIEAGRHPVVEQVVAAGRFVPNDTLLDRAESQIHILTGPNMAGKSTYLRQVGLIVLLAQCGSFVPASRARIGLTDRIFTRVGASDQLALGRSTFLVEMEETANILHHCTDRSLVLLDEIGRGTSTYDGLAIAWAVAEHLHESPGRNARTLFATHYHELTGLTRRYPRIQNFQVAVRRHGERVIFLHEIRPGGCDDSYGIEVARLAGLPAEVVARAREILLELESGDFHPERLERPSPQLGLFTPPTDPLVEELSEIAVETLSPLEALNRLAELRTRARLRRDRT